MPSTSSCRGLLYRPFVPPFSLLHEAEELCVCVSEQTRGEKLTKGYACLPRTEEHLSTIDTDAVSIGWSCAVGTMGEIWKHVGGSWDGVVVDTADC